MQAELGFKVRGTTDAALMSQQSIAVGTASNGFRWLWELKRELHNPMKGPATQEASSRSGKEDQVCLTDCPMQESFTHLHCMLDLQIMQSMVLLKAG